MMKYGLYLLATLGILFSVSYGVTLNTGIPENCTSWFDGCNTCGVENGRLTFCTEMACGPGTQRAPYCKKFGEQATGSPEIMVVTVGPAMVDCNAFRRTCLVVDGEPFADWIEGFDYEAGYIYELQINKTKRPQRLEDVGDYKYELVEVLSKNPVTVEIIDVNDKNPPIPATCTSWYDGCNTCMVENGKLGGCTRKFCSEEQQGIPWCLVHKSTYQPPEPVELPDPNAVPEGCKLWNDGCRDCKISRDGEKDCEDIACFYTGLPECLEYYDEVGKESVSNADSAALENKIVFAVELGRETPGEPPQTVLLKLEPEPKPTFWGFIKYHLFFWQK